MLRGHKYRTGKVASRAVAVAALVVVVAVVGAEKRGGQLVSEFDHRTVSIEASERKVQG